MEKYFNIAGPCVPGEHYMIPALKRLPEVARLIDRKQSFVIHAARQSGKTTALMALVRAIDPDSYFPFPVSVALVGMRDVRDYLAHVRPDAQSLGTASPFNMKTESLGLANFTPERIRRAHDAGLRANVFWSDDPEEARRFLDMGADTILTNSWLKLHNALGLS